MKKSPEIISGRMTFGKTRDKLLVSKLTTERRFCPLSSDTLLVACRLVIKAAVAISNVLWR